MSKNLFRRTSARLTRSLFSFLFAAGCAAGAPAKLPWEFWKSPYAISELDPADQVLERSSYCLDGCRYDHANLTWEGIAANPYPYRWLYTDGGEEVVFEDDGPGAITRAWMTAGNCIDPLTGIRVYVDDATIPVLDIPLYALFDGSTPPFTPPLAYSREQSSGGFVSYVPIAYAKHLRIGLTNADNGYNSCTGDSYRALWFQFQYHRLPLGTQVTSFTGSDDALAFRALLAHSGDDPWEAGLPATSVSGYLAANSSWVLGQRSGPAWLRGIRLNLPRSAFPHVSLKLQFDGRDSVDMPLQDFFAVGDGAPGAARAVLMGEGNDGWLYAWFPMPFRIQGVVTLAADADIGMGIGVDATLYWDHAAVPDDSGTFTAQLNDTCPTTPGADFSLYSGSGAGRVVGLSASYHAYQFAGRDYLEGDERAYRDGAISPSWYGTGVEDFFNGGFYFILGPYSHALSGATAVDADGTGTTSAYRMLLTDFLDYRSAIDLRQEAGPTGLTPMCSRSVAYAYAKPEPNLISYGRLDLGDPGSVAQHSYQAPPGATCALLNAEYGNETPTSSQAVACSFGTGSSTFTFAPPEARAPLRLRRTFDAAIAGQEAEIWVNGSIAGHFAYTQANPARRWQEQETTLSVPVDGAPLNFEIRPRYANTGGATIFSESAYELFGGKVDGIFKTGFD